MGTVKPWQIVVIVVALIGVAVLTVRSCISTDGSLDLADEVHLVDIKSGAVFLAKYPERTPVTYPAKNPETGEQTLYPVYEKENAWYLTSRVIAAARKNPALRPDLIADAKSGLLKLEKPSPKKADVFGD